MCLYPRLIKNPKYLANKKNGGVIPAVPDGRVLYVPIGCQECIECSRKKQREWQVRLAEDIKQHKNAKFITLTFSTESLLALTEETDKKTGLKIKNLKGYQRDNAIATRAVRLFLERWRKKYKKSLRHWLISELGTEQTEHLHLHGIVWTDEPYQTIEKFWSYGYIWPNKDTTKKTYVNQKTVNYITKYVHKRDVKHKTYKPVMLTSAGIGRAYVERSDVKRNQYKGPETNEAYRTPQGNKLALPIYYRNKIYTEEQREQLWLDKLDKQERWICGERVDLATVKLQEFYTLLDWHQKRSAALGYGNGKKDWDKIEYENARRDMIAQKRLEKYSAAQSDEGRANT